MNDDSTKKDRHVRCPHCGLPALYAPENPYRPFCSERCRLIDLGQWADETYRVPASDSSSFTLSEDDLEDNEE